NRLTTETWYDVNGNVVGTNTFSYDAVGNQLTALNGNGTYTLSYDALNRVTVANEPFGKTLTFSYDAVGNRTQVQDSAGGIETSTYDAHNRLSLRKFSGISSTVVRVDLTYQSNGLLDTLTRYSDLAGSTKVGATTYLYDAVSRVTGINHYNGSGTALATYAYT